MVQIEQATFAYPRGKHLFDGLHLDLPKGRVVGLLGRNGEGKSTLMKLIAGQLLPSRGKVRTLGYDTELRPVGMLQRLYMLSEDLRLPRQSVRAFFDNLAPLYPSYDEQLADECIRSLEIGWEMKTQAMSLGQRKKVCIALALALRTPLLLMDEPTNGLDIPSKSVFRQLITQHLSPEQTVIISTHQVYDLEQLINHLVLLEGNKIITNASLEELSHTYVVGLVAKAEGSAPLYVEATPLGAVGIWRRDEVRLSEEAGFSMELFFNALVRQGR